MGGIRTINGQLLFCPTESEKYVVRHSENLGPDMITTQSCTALKPNKYYNFGTVRKALKIAQFESKNPEILESYRGEFTVGSGGSVVFPSTVRWEREPEFEPGFTYQFRIENNIGTFIKVKSV